MARRIKQNQHWAEVCAGMAMAQVYIEPITPETGAAVEGPADRREPFKLFGPPPGGGDGLGGYGYGFRVTGLRVKGYEGGREGDTASQSPHQTRTKQRCRKDVTFRNLRLRLGHDDLGNT